MSIQKIALSAAVSVGVFFVAFQANAQYAVPKFFDPVQELSPRTGSGSDDNNQTSAPLFENQVNQRGSPWVAPSKYVPLFEPADQVNPSPQSGPLLERWWKGSG